MINDSVEAANIFSSTTVLFIKRSQVFPVALCSINYYENNKIASMDKISQSKRRETNIKSSLHRMSCQTDELCKQSTLLPYGTVKTRLQLRTPIFGVHADWVLIYRVF